MWNDLFLVGIFGDQCSWLLPSKRLPLIAVSVSLRAKNSVPRTPSRRMIVTFYRPLKSRRQHDTVLYKQNNCTSQAIELHLTSKRGEESQVIFFYSRPLAMLVPIGNKEQNYCENWIGNKESKNSEHSSTVLVDISESGELQLPL